jgi:threonine/homoserine/homoserine lactone efflux protein
MTAEKIQVILCPPSRAFGFPSDSEDYYPDSCVSNSMEFLDFAGIVVLVTASGALAPGPLFFANLSHGSRAGARSGLVFSVAHTCVEFTLVITLALGLVTVASEAAVRFWIGLAGGTALIVFGAVQVWISLVSKITDPKPSMTNSRSLFIMGLSFTGLNPFFIVWWLTAGAQLVVISLEFASLTGVFIMYVCHIWMDYLWLTVTAHLAKVGLSVVGLRMYRIVLAAFSFILIYFGLIFLSSSISSLPLL